MKNAAETMLKEVKKYEVYLEGWLPRLACVLDPRIGTSSTAALELKPNPEEPLRREYGYIINEEANEEEDLIDMSAPGARLFGAVTISPSVQANPARTASTDR